MLTHNASQTAALDEATTCDQIAQCWLQKFHSRDMNLEDQESRNVSSVKQNVTGTC